MINNEMMSLGKKSSVIREIFEYAKRRKAEIGADNVFDFSIGNPSIPAPDVVNETMKKLSILLAVLLCLTMTACEKEKKERIPPTRSTDPVFEDVVTRPTEPTYRTSVYVTVYGDTAYLATYPYEIYILHLSGKF